MKEIRAYIQPFMLAKLTQALLKIPGFPGMSVSDCEGFGDDAVEGGANFNPFSHRKRIEIFAPDELVPVIFETVMMAANTHRHGAGKVYVLPVLEGGRVLSGKQGVDLA